ncbi:hypothetical protein TB1_026557 [Malus domestica]
MATLVFAIFVVAQLLRRLLPKAHTPTITPRRRHPTPTCHSTSSNPKASKSKKHPGIKDIEPLCNFHGRGKQKASKSVSRSHKAGCQFPGVGVGSPGSSSIENTPSGLVSAHL